MGKQLVATYGLPDLFVPRLHLVPEYTFPQNAMFTVFSLRPFTCGTTPPLLHRYCTATHLRAQVEEQPGALVVQREVPHGVFVPNLLGGENALGKEGGSEEICTFTCQKTSVQGEGHCSSINIRLDSRGAFGVRTVSSTTVTPPPLLAGLLSKVDYSTQQEAPVPIRAITDLFERKNPFKHVPFGFGTVVVAE